MTPARPSLLWVFFALTGCAHGELRKAVRIGPFESTSVKNIQVKAEAAFPLGMPFDTVQQQLGRDRDEVSPVVMFLTLRPWPFDPWDVWTDQQGTLHATSENDRNWFIFFMRSYIRLDFDFDADKRLKSVKVSKDGVAL